MTPKEEQKWKRSLTLHKYAGRFELAEYRTRKLGFPPVELLPVEKFYWSDFTRDGFLDFAKTKYAPVFNHGLSGTCIIIHSGLLEAVKEYFACDAVLTIGSLTTSKGEMYEMDEATVLEWKRNGINLLDAEIHTWITLDSMEILDMTFLPTIAEVSGKKQLLEKSPIALDPDVLTKNLLKYDPDVLSLPRGIKYNPFIIGSEVLSAFGMPTAVIY